MKRGVERESRLRPVWKRHIINRSSVCLLIKWFSHLSASFCALERAGIQKKNLLIQPPASNKLYSVCCQFDGTSACYTLDFIFEI